MNKSPKSLRTKMLSVFSVVPEDYELWDRRWNHYGLVFGKVKDVARNLGVKIIKRDGYLEFQAPQNRMQAFIERLHFSAIRYGEVAPKKK